MSVIHWLRSFLTGISQKVLSDGCLSYCNTAKCLFWSTVYLALFVCLLVRSRERGSSSASVSSDLKALYKSVIIIIIIIIAYYYVSSSNFQNIPVVVGLLGSCDGDKIRITRTRNAANYIE